MKTKILIDPKKTEFSPHDAQFRPGVYYVKTPHGIRASVRVVILTVGALWIEGSQCSAFDLARIPLGDVLVTCADEIKITFSA